MKAKFSYFLGFAVILLVVMSFNANAQEGIPNNEIPDLNFRQSPDLQEERPLLFEPSTTSTEKPSQNKEQLNSASKSGKVKTVEGAKPPVAKPEEQDALSFNFLYYIIQKFKISDIVEQ